MGIEFRRTKAAEARAAGVFIMRWGKHAGKPITEVPKDYLEWMSAEKRDDYEQAHFELQRRSVSRA